MQLSSPVPQNEPIAVGKDNQDRPLKLKASVSWLDWWLNQEKLINAMPTVVVHRFSVTGQLAAVATTPFALGVGTQAARYRVNYVLALEQQATTSSSVGVSMGYILDGIARLEARTPLTSNNLAAIQSGSFICDPDTGVLTWSTTYGSVGGTPMRYALAWSIEALP